MCVAVCACVRLFVHRFLLCGVWRFGIPERSFDVWRCSEYLIVHSTLGEYRWLRCGDNGRRQWWPLSFHITHTAFGRSVTASGHRRGPEAGTGRWRLWLPERRQRYLCGFKLPGPLVTLPLGELFWPSEGNSYCSLLQQKQKTLWLQIGLLLLKQSFFMSNLNLIVSFSALAFSLCSPEESQ